MHVYTFILAFTLYHNEHHCNATEWRPDQSCTGNGYFQSWDKKTNEDIAKVHEALKEKNKKRKAHLEDVDDRLFTLEEECATNMMANEKTQRDMAHEIKTVKAANCRLHTQVMKMRIRIAALEKRTRKRLKQ